MNILFALQHLNARDQFFSTNKMQDANRINRIKQTVNSAGDAAQGGV
jgi:hypothetical protein